MLGSTNSEPIARPNVKMERHGEGKMLTSQQAAKEAWEPQAAGEVKIHPSKAGPQISFHQD